MKFFGEGEHTFLALGFQLSNEDGVNLIFWFEMNEPPTRCLILIQDKSLVADLAAISHFLLIVESAESESELVKLIESLLVNLYIDHQRERHGHV
jgi:hypothetical protein